MSLFTSCENNAPNATSVVQQPSETAEITSAVDVTETTDVTEETSENQEEEPADDEEDYSTGAASLDNIRNQDGIGEKELLVLSFGTSFNDSRRLTIGAIEQELEDSFADFSVRRGFRSNIIIHHVIRRDGFLIDDIEASLKRAVDNGVKTLVVQPTHLMNGIEYDEIVEKVAQYSGTVSFEIRRTARSSTVPFLP